MAPRLSSSGAASGHAVRQRGMSLIEALVALAVMAFGMLGIVGVQATLRFNSDVAKQRSEAVRLAQQSIEDARSFMLVNTTAGVFDYTDITALSNQALTGLTTNTAYRIDRDVLDSGALPSSDDPRMKTLRVTVRWADRTAAATASNQSVEMNTVVAPVPPELAGTLSLAANVDANGLPSQGPGGRSAAIPRAAVDFGNGTSGFMPPQASGGNVAWVFNNTTGVITLCRSSATATALLALTNIDNCGSDSARLLTGYVRFAYSTVPTAAIAENPTDSALNLDVAVTAAVVESSTPLVSATCYDDAPTTAAVAATRTTVIYYCAVVPGSNGLWSGISTIVPAGLDGGAAWVIPSSLPAASGYRVCRYTPTVSDTPPNPEHPRIYVDVTAAQLLNNQNFLVINAAQSCPTDGIADPSAGDFVNSNTRQHQPAP